MVVKMHLEALHVEDCAKQLKFPYDGNNKELAAATLGLHAMDYSS